MLRRRGRVIIFVGLTNVVVTEIISSFYNTCVYTYKVIQYIFTTVGGEGTFLNSDNPGEVDI